MKNVLIIIELLISVLVVGSILIQAKGTGLSSSFGGGGEFYRSKRGVEKIVVYATIFLVICFGLVSLTLLLVS